MTDEETCIQLYRDLCDASMRKDAAGMAVFEKNVVILPGKGVIAAVPFCHPRNFPTVDGATGDNREKNYFEGLAVASTCFRRAMKPLRG